MKIASIVGTRPQFVKLGPMHRALVAAGHHHLVLHTGQHHDHDLSAGFTAQLGLPEPDVHLGVGSGPHGAQTGAMLTGLERALTDLRPQVVLNYGDTNSTLAGTLAAAKMGLRTAHIEAGLRSFDRHMPEELNRVVVDHLCDLDIAPTDTAMQHLAREGLADRAVLVGDIMFDILRDTAARVTDADLVAGARPGTAFVLATIHRAENTDDPDRLRSVVAALAELGMPVILPVHPRLRDRARSAGIALDRGSLIPVAPLTYDVLVATVQRARAVVTDSGGLQKEAFWLGTPCTTVRSSTEWPETFEGGANVLCEDPAGLAAAVLRPTSGGTVLDVAPVAPRMVTVIEERLGPS